MKKTDTQSVNHLYNELRQQHSEHSALVNGYRSHRYFINEQKLVLKLLESKKKLIRVLDLACGSGLMTQPLTNHGIDVIGLDFNYAASLAANQQLTHSVQGNAFQLPFADNCFDRIVNCQFLNQQNPDDVITLFQECHRILNDQGELVLVWRNGEALIHKFAHALFTLKDKFTNNPNFPVFDHPISDVATSAKQIGFVVKQEFVFFSLLGRRITKPNSLLGKIFGASAVMILTKDN